MHACSVACVVSYSSALRTVAHRVHLSMGFFWQEYFSGLPCSPSGDLPDPEIESGSPALQVNSLPPEPPGKQIAIDMDIDRYG